MYVRIHLAFYSILNDQSVVSTSNTATENQVENLNFMMILLKKVKQFKKQKLSNNQKQWKQKLLIWTNIDLLYSL